jgi:hypothetical protein
MEERLMSRQRICGALIFLLAAALSAFAALSGDIEGFVTDPTGAFVPGAAVTIHNLETGVQRNLATDDRGHFLATFLPVGEYEVRAEVANFRPAVQRILVKAAERASLNLGLVIGVVTEQVTVTETSVQFVNTTDSQIQISIDAKRITELPLLGRNPLALTGLAPGIVPAMAGNSFLGPGGFNSNGGRGRSNNVTIDNIVSTDVTSAGSTGINTLSLDGIQEIKLIANNFNAEFGRNASSQLQIITRSGSNEFHGTVYEFLMNDRLNARDWFDRTGQASIIRRNQFGATAGGAILRDRLFFFGHYEGLQIRGAGGTRIAAVPTGTHLAGVTDPTSQAILATAKLPEASLVDSAGNGTVSQSAPTSTKSNAWSMRMDNYFNSGRDIVNGRFSSQAAEEANVNNTFLGTNLAGWGATVRNDPKNFHIGWTHIFDSQLANEVRVAYGRATSNFAPQTDILLPRIQIIGMAPFGMWEGLPQGRIQNTFQYSDMLTWTRGRHNLKFGGDFHRVQANSILDAFTRGIFTFNSWADFAAGRPATYQQRFGSTARGNRVSNAFLFAQDDFKVTPDFTLNLGFRLEIAGDVSEVNDIQSNLDIHKPGPGPLGDFVLGSTIYGTNANYQPRVGFAWNPDRGTWVVRGGYGITHDFVFLNPITSASRTLPPFIQRIDLTAGAFTGADSYANVVAGTAAIQGQGRAAVGKFSPTQVNFSSINPIDTKLRNPQVQQWSLTVERQLAADLAVRVGYVGTAGRYLLRNRQINMIPPNLVRPATSEADEIARLSDFQRIFNGSSGTPTLGSNRIDPRFNSVGIIESSGSSSFHALESELNKRFSRGWQVQASYTWSKSIDDGSEVLNGALPNDSFVAQNPLDLANSKGLSQFDIPHRLVVNHILEPQLFRDVPGVAGKLLHGWALNGIFQTQSGFPVTILAGPRLGITDAALSGNSAAANIVRANVAGDLNSLVFAPAGSAEAGRIPSPAARGINANATDRNTNTSNYPLTQPLIGHYGNMGRNVLRLNSLTQFDWIILKNTAINESVTAQFRAEFFNVFNNTAFAGFQNTLSSPSFGTYQSTLTRGREIQLALKLLW